MTEAENNNAERGQRGLGVGEVLQISLRQVVVTDHGRKRQEEQDECDGVCAPGADRIGECRLRQRGTLDVIAAIGDCGAEQHNKRGDGAHEQGVKVHAEGLHKSLLNGVRHGRSRGSIWCRTHACLVGEQTTTHTVCEGCANGRARNLLEAESVANDEFEHAWDLAPIDHQHREACLLYTSDAADE